MREGLVAETGYAVGGYVCLVGFWIRTEAVDEHAGAGSDNDSLTKVVAVSGPVAG